MKLDYQKLRELVKQSVKECGGGMVHPTAAPSPITIIPSEKPDHEGKMAKQQIFAVINDASQLEALLLDDDQLPAWVQSKITKASDYISAVKKYLEYELARGPSAMMPPMALPPMNEQAETLSSGDWKDLAGLLTRAVSGAQGSGEKSAYSEALDFAQNVVKYLQENLQENMTLKEGSADISLEELQELEALLTKARSAMATDFAAKSILRNSINFIHSRIEARKGVTESASDDPVVEASDKAKEASGDKKVDVQTVAKFMFKSAKLGPALAKIKDDPRETAQLIAVVAGQLGLNPDELAGIARKAKGEM